MKCPSGHEAATKKYRKFAGRPDVCNIRFWFDVYIASWTIPRNCMRGVRRRVSVQFVESENNVRKVCKRAAVCGS